MYKVLIVKLTNIDKNIINSIVLHLTQLGFEVHVMNEIEHINISYFNWERMQYDAEKILDYLDLKYSSLPFDSVLAIGEIDAYAKGLNFVFGLSKYKVGTVYLSRLKEEFYGRKPNLELYIERVKKEVTHELGHTLGLPHCSNPGCVMNFSNSVYEVDKKTEFFCKDCLYRLNINNKS